MTGLYSLQPYSKTTPLSGQTVQLQDVQKGIELLLEKFPRQTDKEKAIRAFMILFEHPVFLPESKRKVSGKPNTLRHMVVRSKKQAIQIDAMVNIAYARFADGRFPDEISDARAKIALPFDPTVDYHLAISTDATGEFSALAAFKAKMHINPTDAGAFVNQLFTITDKWFLNEKKVQELSRWAAHPVFDLQRLMVEEYSGSKNSASIAKIQTILQGKIHAMKTVLSGAVSYGAAHNEASICIFSEGVADFIRQNNIACIRKLEARPLDSPLRKELNDHYASYWVHGNPAVYEVKPVK